MGETEKTIHITSHAMTQRMNVCTMHYSHAEEKAVAEENLTKEVMAE